MYERTSTKTFAMRADERGRDWCVVGYEHQAINPPSEAIV